MAHGVGLVTALLAAGLWLLGRWLHEVQRCLGKVGAGARPLDDCAPLIDWPRPAFGLWFPLMALTAFWGIYLLATGRGWLGATTLCAALGVFFLATSFM